MSSTFETAAPHGGRVDTLTGGLETLQSLLEGAESVDGTLRRIAATAQELVPACDSASVFVSPNAEMVTRSVASDQFAAMIDDLQVDADEGPCLEAIRTNEPVFVDRIETEGRFPTFAALADDLGLDASYSVPLQVDGRVMGSLNLYGRNGTFAPQERAWSDAMAAQAALALANAGRYAAAVDVIANLADAIATRDVIGQAKGILMERHGIGADEAFARLKDISQTLNVKLREVAFDVTSRRGVTVTQQRR